MILSDIKELFKCECGHDVENHAPGSLGHGTFCGVFGCACRKYRQHKEKHTPEIPPQAEELAERRIL